VRALVDSRRSRQRRRGCWVWLSSEALQWSAVRLMDHLRAILLQGWAPVRQAAPRARRRRCRLAQVFRGRQEGVQVSDCKDPPLVLAGLGSLVLALEEHLDSVEVAHRQVSLLVCLLLGLHPQASNHQEHPEEDLEAHQALVEDEVPNLWQKNKN